jgi:hypothetical protein
MDAAFTCSSPTVSPEVNRRERFERIEARVRLLRELEAYAEDVRSTDRLPAVDDALVGFPVELPEIEYETIEA